MWEESGPLQWMRKRGYVKAIVPEICLPVVMVSHGMALLGPGRSLHCPDTRGKGGF